MILAVVKRWRQSRNWDPHGPTQFQSLVAFFVGLVEHGILRDGEYAKASETDFGFELTSETLYFFCKRTDLSLVLSETYFGGLQWKMKCVIR